MFLAWGSPRTVNSIVSLAAVIVMLGLTVSNERFFNAIDELGLITMSGKVLSNCAWLSVVASLKSFMALI